MHEQPQRFVGIVLLVGTIVLVGLLSAPASADAMTDFSPNGSKECLNTRTVDITWEEEYSNRLAGYSYVWDNTSNTNPDTPIEIESPQPLSFGLNGEKHWLHIRRVDGSDYDDEIHDVGPFCYEYDGDLKVNVSSPSHGSDVSLDRNVTMQINVSNASFADKVYLTWDHSNDTTVGGSGDAKKTWTGDNVTSEITTTEKLATGDWYLHASAKDQNGDITNTSHYGPIRLRDWGYTAWAIDNSGSMNATTGGGKKVEVARNATRSAVNTTSDDTYVAILKFDSSKSTAQDMIRRKDNFSKISQAISGSEDVSGSTDLGAPLSSAVFPDGQENDSGLVVESDGKLNIPSYDNHTKMWEDFADEVCNFRDTHISLYHNPIGSGAYEGAYSVGCGSSSSSTQQSLVSRATSQGETTTAVKERVSNTVNPEVSTETTVVNRQLASTTVQASTANQPAGVSEHAAALPDDMLSSFMQTVREIEDDELVTETDTLVVNRGRQTKQFSLGPDARRATVNLWVQNTETTVTLRTPSGTPATDSSRVEKGRFGHYVAYRITEPVAGQWTYTINTAEDRPIKFRAVIGVNTPASLKATGPETAKKGDTATIRASLETSSTGRSATADAETVQDAKDATVDATVLLPDGSRKAVDLERSGTGYTGTVPVNMVGPYDVSVAAKNGNLQLEERLGWQGNGFDTTAPPIDDFQVLRVKGGSGDPQLLITFDSREPLERAAVRVYRYDETSDKQPWKLAETVPQLNRVGDTYITRSTIQEDEQYAVVIERATDKVGIGGAENHYTLVGAPDTNTAQFKLSPTKKRVEAGETFNISMETSGQVDSYQTVLEYDPESVRITSINPTPTSEVDSQAIAQSTQSVTANAQQRGSRSAIGSDLVTFDNERGRALLRETDTNSSQVATITMEAVTDINDRSRIDVTIDPTRSLAETTDGNRLLVTEHDKTQVIANAAAGSTPDDVPALTADRQAPQNLDNDGTLEDVDGDGRLSIFDVQLLFKQLNGETVQAHADEFNFDGKGGVNIFDVQALFKMITS
jgi:hypothetical protein